MIIVVMNVVIDLIIKVGLFVIMFGLISVKFIVLMVVMMSRIRLVWLRMLLKVIVCLVFCFCGLFNREFDLLLGCFDMLYCV